MRLLDAMAADGLRPGSLKVDGGMSQNDIAAFSRSETRFEPNLGASERDYQIFGWRDSLRRVRST